MQICLAFKTINVFFFIFLKTPYGGRIYSLIYCEISVLATTHSHDGGKMPHSTVYYNVFLLFKHKANRSRGWGRPTNYKYIFT